MRKGISPLVAAVLLIASTMAIAGILAYWASSFVRSSLPPVNNTQTECTGSNFAIVGVPGYNSTTKSFIVNLENTGSYAITLNGIDFIYVSGNVENHQLTDTLPAGTSGIKSFQVNNVTDGFVKFRVGTACPSLFKEG